MKKLKKTEGGMYCFLVTFDPSSEVLNVVDLNAQSQATDADQSIVTQDSSTSPDSQDKPVTRDQPQATKTEVKMEDKDSESIESFATSTTEAPREVQRKSRPPKARRDYSPSDLLSRQEAAEYLGVAEQTLAVWKCTGRYDLPYVKIGKLVKYRKTDLDRFIEGMKHESLAWKKRDP